MESDEYEPALDKLKDDINELTGLLKKNDIIKPEDITKALEESEARTEQDIKETEENANTTAQEVWDTNKGYMTSSDEQEKGKAAAEEYAKNSALAHAAEEAANDLAKAKRELQEAFIDYGSAQSEYDKASTARAEAKIASEEREKIARADSLAASGIVNAGIHSGNPPETVGGLTAGTFLSENGKDIITVEHKDDKTTIRVESSDGSYTTRTYSSSDDFKTTEETVKDTANKSRAEADKAKANLEQKNAKEKKALENLEKVAEEIANAEAKVDKAKIEAEKAEANVPDVNKDPSKGESSSDGGKAKEQAEKSMEENRGKNGMPSNL